MAAAPAASAKTIPIVVDQYVPDPRPGAPVKCGVPFPRGELKVADAAAVRVVDGGGRAVPHQARITATWNPDGSDGVRWLLVDFLADPGQSYALAFNEPGSAPAAALPAIAVITNGAIAIDTGPITGTMPDRGGRIFDGLMAMGGPLVVKPGTNDALPFNGFYVEHEKKGVFRADLDPEATVVLEESGPIRATLKADGWYANAAGEKFCRYSVRLHFFRGRQDIKLEHTFIYTGLSAEDRVRSVSLQLRRTSPEEGKNVRAFAGGEDLLAGRVVNDFTGAFRLIQDQSERGRFDLYSPASDGNPPLKYADRGGGWMTTLGTFGMSVAIRDAWQQFPYELELESGAVRVHFWPRHGRLLDTTWDGYWWFLTEQQKRFHAGRKPHKEKELDDWIARLRKTVNATGAAKTHEVWLSFMGPGYGAYPTAQHRSYGSLAREVAYPALAHADLDWTGASRALDFLPQAARNMALFRDEENHMQALFTMVQDAMAANNWYGWWDWGGYHQHLSVGPQFPRSGTYADDAGQAAWHRAHPKSHYGWGGLLWVQVLRTGRRDWLRYAQTYTLYSADRAHTHHTGNGRTAGAEFHYDNSEIPWLGGYQYTPSGDQLASNLQGKDDYVYQYWLTGDRRPLDVLLSWGEQILAANARGAKWGTWKPGFERGNDIRNAGMQLHRVMMLYQATWDPRYLNLARTIASAFLPLDTEAKVAVAELSAPGVYFHAADGWAYEGMWFYWNVTRDEAFKKALLAFIERSRHYDAGFMGGYGFIRACTYGYQLTGDTLYLDLARGACDSIVAEGVTPWSFLPGYKMNINPFPRFLGTMLAAPPAWREANLPTHERGQQFGFRYCTWKNNPHMIGARVYFREDRDRAWSFDAAFSFGGKIVLYRPDGTVAVEKTVNLGTNKLVRFSVPADGQKGDYALACVEPSQAWIDNVNPGEQPGLARIVRKELPLVVQAAVPPQSDPVYARAQYFGVPAGTTNAAVELRPGDRRRDCELREAGGAWRADTRGMLPRQDGALTLAIPGSGKDRRMGLSLTTPPDAYFEKGQGRVGVIVRNVPPFVAADPADWFVPEIPAAPR